MAGQTASQRAMTTQEVTIKLRAPDLKPPVYIAGSFTKEPWSPVEMDVEGIDWENNKIIATTYYKTFNLNPGEYQYKFRLGDGDWWICDENGEIVKDDLGNINNHLIVLPADDAEDSGSTVNESAVNQEAKNFGNLLPKIASPQLQASPEHGSVVEEEIPHLPDEMALGTWQPDDEFSPVHRRASTSLGVRISRMGTFLPPSDEEMKEPESFVDEEAKARKIDRLRSIDRFPPNRHGLIVKLKETANKAENEYDGIARFDGSFVDPFGNIEIARINSMVPRIKVSNLDSILEVPQEMFESGQVEGYVATVQNGFSPLGTSYGTMTTASSVDTTSEKIGAKYLSNLDEHNASPAPAPFIEPTNLRAQSTNDSKASGVLSEPVTDSKERNADADAPRGFVLFAILAAWFRGIWKRLFSGPKKNRNTNDSDHN